MVRSTSCFAPPPVERSIRSNTLAKRGSLKSSPLPSARLAREKFESAVCGRLGCRLRAIFRSVGRRRVSAGFGRRRNRVWGGRVTCGGPVFEAASKRIEHRVLRVDRRVTSRPREDAWYTGEPARDPLVSP